MVRDGRAVTPFHTQPFRTGHSVVFCLSARVAWVWFPVYFWAYHCCLPYSELNTLNHQCPSEMDSWQSLMWWTGLIPCPLLPACCHSPYISPPSLSLPTMHAKERHFLAMLYNYTVWLGKMTWFWGLESTLTLIFLFMLIWHDGILQPCQLPKCISIFILRELCTKLNQSRCHLAA